MTKLRPIVRYVLQVYVGLLALLAVTTVGAMKLQHEHLLSVQTGSMQQAIAAGDAVLVKPLGGSGLHVGQVVSYVSPATDTIISHRVVSVDVAHGQLTTRGDALAKPDTPISRSAVIGRVVVLLPHAGSVLDFMRRPLGLALFVYAPAFAIIAGEVQRLGRHYRRGFYRLAAYRRTF